MPTRPATAAADAIHAARAHLTSLQTWQLKRIAVNIGVPAGTNKASTCDAILTGLGQSASRARPAIIKSVDMGVKNLAFTLMEQATSVGARTRQSTAGFVLRDWQRMNVLTGVSTTTDAQAEGEEDGEEMFSSDNDQSSAVMTPANMYSPANLAPAAARLARQLAENSSPELILIERQRFRSAGGAAVQEWTLRVNSLEAMLWASLETLRSSAAGSASFPPTIEMSPARVAAYWNTRGSDWSLEEDESDEVIPHASRKPRKKDSKGDPDATAKRGMEKSEKIALVRNWLENGAVDVDGSLQPLANAFMSLGPIKKNSGVLQVGKKDDLADCVVQGVTFGLWERSRHRLSQSLGLV